VEATRRAVGEKSFARKKGACDRVQKFSEEPVRSTCRNEWPRDNRKPGKKEKPKNTVAAAQQTRLYQ